MLTHSGVPDFRQTFRGSREDRHGLVLGDFAFPMAFPKFAKFGTKFSIVVTLYFSGYLTACGKFAHSLINFFSFVK